MSIEGWSPKAENDATPVTVHPESYKSFSEAMAALKKQAEDEEQIATNVNEAPGMPADSVPVEVEAGSEGFETAEYNPETAEGLRNLLDATEDIYSDIAALRQQAERDGFKTLIEQGMPPERAYTIFDRGYDRVARVQELITELRDERLPAGEPVKLEEIDRLQSLIDILSDERRRVQKAYDRPAPEAPATSEHEAINHAWDDAEGATVPESTPAPDTATSAETGDEDSTESSERDEVEHAVFMHVDRNRSLAHADRAEVHELLAAYRNAEDEAMKADWAEAIRQKIDALRAPSGRDLEATSADSESENELETAAVESGPDEPMVLLGMQLPAAGPAGVFGARSFREGLQFVRDRHPALTADPAKIEDLDRMVQLLGVVPESGLSEAQVAELRDLAERIDVSEGLIPTTEAAAEGESAESNDEAVDRPSVFGMTIPEAGPAGVFAARSLREGLIVTRDRHPELIKDPEKQQTVDRMVRLLRDVPVSGLTEAVVAELEALASDIGISEGLIPARQAAAQEQAIAGTLPPEKPLTEAQKAVTKNLGELAQEQAQKRRGAMSIETDPADDGDLQISIKKPEKTDTQPSEPAEPAEEPAVSEVSSEVVAETPPAPADPTALNAVERRDPVNRAMPNELLQRDDSRALEMVSESTRSLLGDPEIAEFVAARFSSPRAYERFLETEVEKIEAETADPFGKWLGESPAGTFETYLKDKSVAEFRTLMARSRDELRAELRSMNLKYETFSAWEDIFTKLDEELDDIDPDMTFGEFVAKWITFSEMSYYEGDTTPSQFTA